MRVLFECLRYKKAIHAYVFLMMLDIDADIQQANKKRDL